MPSSSATVGTVTKVPACITARTGTRSRSPASFAARNTTSSDGSIGRRAARRLASNRPAPTSARTRDVVLMASPRRSLQTSEEGVDEHPGDRERPERAAGDQRDAARAPPLDRHRVVRRRELEEALEERARIFAELRAQLRRDGRTLIRGERLGDLLGREQPGGVLVHAVRVAA